MNAPDDAANAPGPIFGRGYATLGRRRFDAMVQGQSKLQAMAMFLLLSVSIVPQIGYTDDALDALRNDAQDLREAADEWATACDELADHWQAQRQEHDPR